MKKRLIFIIIIIALLLISASTVLVIHFSKNKATVKPQEEVIKTKLTTPKNVQINNALLTWNEVPDANGYLVTIGDKTIIVNTNSLNLKDYEYSGFVNIIAKGDDLHLSSDNSLTLYYADHIDQKVVNKINQVVDYYFTDQFNFNNIDNQYLANALYLEGFDEIVTDRIFTFLAELISFDNINGFNKINALDDLFNSFVNYSNINHPSYLKARGLIKLLSYYYKELDKNDINNTSTFYYSFDTKKNNINALAYSFNNLNEQEIVSLAKTVDYLEQLYLAFKQFMELSNEVITNKNDQTNELMSFYQKMSNVLFDHLPDVLDFDVLRTFLTDLYVVIVPLYLQEAYDVSALDHSLKAFYNKNHQLIAFSKYLNDEDSRSFFKYLQAFLKSLDKEKITDIIDLFNTDDLVFGLSETINNLKGIEWSNYLNNEFIKNFKNATSDDVISLDDFINLFKIEEGLDYHIKQYEKNSENDRLIISLLEENNIAVIDGVNPFYQYIDAFENNEIKKIDSNYIILLNELMKQGAIQFDYQVLSDYLFMSPTSFTEMVIVLSDAIEIVTLNNEKINRYFSLFADIGNFLDYFRLLQNLENLDNYDFNYQMPDAGELNTSIDFIDLYNISLLLKPKYAKFMYSYNEVYQLDESSDLTLAYQRFLYFFLFGTNAENVEDAVNYLIELACDFKECMAKYEDEINIIKESLEQLIIDLPNGVSDDLIGLFNNLLINLNVFYDALINNDELFDEEELTNLLDELFTKIFKIVDCVNEADIKDNLDLFINDLEEYLLFALSFVQSLIDEPDSVYDYLDIKKLSEIYLFMGYPIFSLFVSE